MGAEDFTVTARGRSSRDAFREAQEDARYEYGHGGYTGTIAEKCSFRMVTPRDGESPGECADRLVNDERSPYYDKWGPAGCIRLGEDQYLFFGWASS